MSSKLFRAVVGLRISLGTPSAACLGAWTNGDGISPCNAALAIATFDIRAP
jgi:hypothetical protein